MSHLFFPLPVQKISFQVKTPSETAETPGTDYPVSRENERERVSVHCLPHCPGAPGSADYLRNFSIGPCLAERYVRDALPYHALKGGALNIKRNAP